MRITCPSCHTNYEVSAARVGGVPTAARCTRCKREFTVIPPDEPEPPAPAPAPVAFAPVVIPPPPEPPPFAPAEPAPEPSPVPLANPFRPAPDAGPPPPPERGHRGAIIGWVVSLAALAALVLLVTLFRDGIMAAWPPSQRLFHLFGSR